VNTTTIPLVDLSLQHVEIAAEVAAGFERVIGSSAFVLGPEVTEFEREYAEFCSVQHCIGVGNGTDAIELALRAHGIGQGDEVIIPANTFVATAGAVLRTGATPVLVDCDEKYLLIDTSRIEERITERTRAIIPVHLYGQLAPMQPVLDIAARHGLAVIEDGAQSQGAEQDGRKSGSWGNSGATSFYPGKNLGAYGDGGAVVTDSDAIAEAIRNLRNHGGTTKYQHPHVGFNSRLDALQAVVLRAKLRRLEHWNSERREAASRYETLLADVETVSVPATLPGNLHAWHLYVVQVPERDRVVAELNSAGVGAGIHYPIPVHLHGAYAHLGHQAEDFPNAYAAAGRILSLPLYPGIRHDQQEQVVAALRHCVG
jgi:dTDP-4-amino-4,6-dideoxygalactose transaminase